MLSHVGITWSFLSCFLTCLPGSEFRCKLISPYWVARILKLSALVGRHSRHSGHGGHQLTFCCARTQQSAPWNLLLSDTVPQTVASLSSFSPQPRLLISGRHPGSSMGSPACPVPGDFLWVIGRSGGGSHLLWFSSISYHYTLLPSVPESSSHIFYPA